MLQTVLTFHMYVTEQIDEAFRKQKPPNAYFISHRTVGKMIQISILTSSISAEKPARSTEAGAGTVTSAGDAGSALAVARVRVRPRLRERQMREGYHASARHNRDRVPHIVFMGFLVGSHTTHAKQ